MEFLPIKIGGNKVYAGFWKRFGAALVDVLVFFPPYLILKSFIDKSLAVAMISVVLIRILQSLYPVFFHYRFGATLGKMVVGIKVTFPNGTKIGLKQAVLRASVALGLTLLEVIAEIVAISNADPDQYFSVGGREREIYLGTLFQPWYAIIILSERLWGWSELIVLLFNKRKRAIHDFIAGTVVIHKKFAKLGAQLDAVDAGPFS